MHDQALANVILPSVTTFAYPDVLVDRNDLVLRH